MRRIAISQLKGGVGKTTTAVSLAAGLANRGQSVLLIDTDTQAHCSEVLGVKPDRGLAELVNQESQPEEVLFEARDRLWLLAGGTRLAGIKRLISRQDLGGERILTEALEPVERQFDFILLDTAPGWDSLSVNVLIYAQEIIAPVSLEIITLSSLRTFIERLDQVRRYNPDLLLKYILPTFLDRRVKKSQEIMDVLNKHFPDQVCQPIRYSVRLSEAPGFGETIYEYDPRSTGAEDYAVFTEKVATDG